MTRSQRPVWLGVDERRWDHIRVHVQILKDERIGAYELAVYLGIAAHAELASGQAYPAVTTLARYACCDERTVRRSVAKLADLQYLRIDPQPGKASMYALLPPPPLPRTLMHPTPDSHVRGTPDSGPDEQEPVTKTKEPAPRGGDDDPDFAAFWQAYPRKIGKGTARKAWRSALGKTDAATLLRFAAEFATDVALVEPKYVPHPTTWLNGERWDDQRDRVVPDLFSSPRTREVDVSAGCEQCGDTGWLLRDGESEVRPCSCRAA